MALSMGSVAASGASSIASSSCTFLRAAPGSSLTSISYASTGLSAARVKAPAAVSPKCADQSREAEAGMTRVVAAGAAALAVLCSSCSGGALAVSAPERAAQKSQEILKSAEKMDMRDAPNWFGSGRVRSEQDPSKKGGIATAPDLRKGAEDVVGKAQEGAGNIASKASDSSRDILGRAKSALGGGDMGDGGDVASNLQEGAKGALNQAQAKKGQVESGVKDAIGQAPSNPNAGSGMGIVDSVQQGLQGIKDTVSDKSSDAKSALDDAASTAQSKLNMK